MVSRPGTGGDVAKPSEILHEVPATPVSLDTLAQAIVGRARAIPRNGSVVVRFALEPADLGAVRVRIEGRGDHVRVQIEASSQAALDTLGTGLPRLTTQLQDAGYRHAEVSLSLDSAADPSAHARREQAESRHETPSSMHSRTVTLPTAPASASPIRLSSHFLDRIA